MPTAGLQSDFATTGFHVARGLFSAAEMTACRDDFDALVAGGTPIPGHWEPRGGTDPLARYPRVMHPHEIDPTSRARLLDPRLHTVLRALLDDEPIAVQTMYYFKPPGSRGQAFHQDNFYLRVKPLTCVAAWIAVDASTPDNGGLQLVPNTQRAVIECPDAADATDSFTVDYVAPPPGAEPVPLWLDPGDVLFFNGNVIHGSGPNRTADRWRRSFICHYMPAAATHIADWYIPHALDFGGRSVARAANGDGGPCGPEYEPAREYH